VRIGIGLQAAVPGYRATEIGQWAADSERLGFSAVGVIDRLVYDNLDPLVTLAAAAQATTRIELMTSVINVLWRRNPVLLAKQLLSVDQISGGRLTAGLGMGAWPEDYEVTGEPQKGKGKAFDEALATMRRVWDGEVTAASGPIPAQPKGRPNILLAALVPAGWARVARWASGWAAPAFMFPIVEQPSR
jgi:alkanesulfonate monooxygenase SsuD/methylene tetrahydromethanopterin reductase-like flavin-dependent oxidoreductase (luciferase family)